MAADYGEILKEGLRLVQASERLNGVAEDVADLNRAVNGVAEVAPDLAPELAEVQQRLVEVFEHLTSAVTVVSTKLALLRAEIDEEGESE